MKITDFIKGMIIAYMDQGNSSRITQQKIASVIEKHKKEDQMLDEVFAQQFQVSHSACALIYKQFTQQLSYEDGRSTNKIESIYNQEEKDEICQKVLSKIGLSIKEITNSEDINPKSASKNTLVSILKENNIQPYKQQSIIMVNENQRERRLEFCTKHKRWTKNWQKIIFTDESQILVDSQNKFFYLKKGDKIPIELQKDKKAYPMKVHVWGAICHNKPLFLCRIENNLNGLGYIEILNQFFEQKYEDLPDDFIIQQDNSPVHTAGVVQEYFEENEIPLLEWPPHSPDLSPIENVWSIIKDELWQFRGLIKNDDDLYEFTEYLFLNSENVQKTIVNSYKSLQKRLLAVIDQNGEHL